MSHLLHYSGKVRDVYKMGGDYLLMKATDRISSFDKNIGNIPGKGALLNKMSEFWFKNTTHIVDNHLISIHDDVALVHNCEPFKIEVIVRGYIAGNTDTSLWTHYSKGVREYCGIIFPDGLKKNQKLDCAIVTPTTKGDVDIPISKDDLIKRGYIDLDDCNFIFEKALELFKYGQELADKAGLILVDTKYEFGKDKNGKILLIDELHTCDSSRYWVKSSYETRLNDGLEPTKLDKDCVRDWVKSQCNPYVDEIPEIPENLIQKTLLCYNDFYNSISSVPINSQKFNSLVIILSGSVSDNVHVLKLEKALKNENLEYVSFVASAHRNTLEVLNIINKYEKEKFNIVWITVAGRSNALSGVVAANSKFPVIACPPFSDKMDMMVNINSTLQCPRDVPVMTILEPRNVAVSIKRIFNMYI